MLLRAASWYRPAPAACIGDPRAPDRVLHGLDEIIGTRRPVIAAGHEDANRPRGDPMLKLAMGRLPDDADLCSRPGIGETAALAILVEIPELGASANEAASLADAPIRDDRTWTSKRA